MKGTIVFCIYLPSSVTDQTFFTQFINYFCIFVEFEEQIVFLGLDDVITKEFSVFQCYEKLCQSHQYLINVKRMQCGYAHGDVKNVDNLARIHKYEWKAPSTTSEKSPPKKNGYTKAEWRLCMENPA